MSKIKRGLKRFDKSVQRFFHRVFRLLYKLKPLRPLLRPTYRFVHGHYRLAASVLTMLMLASVVVPVLQYRHTVNKYELNSQAKALLGTADKDLTKKLTFDSQQQLYEFNKEAKHQRTPDQNPVTGLKSQIGGSGADDEQLYSMDAPRDLSKGITYYDNQRDLSFKITPQFATLPAEVREGHLIYPLAGSSGQVAYTVTATGLKQNVVLYKSPGDALSMNYKLDLPKSLEARMIDETGEVGIYSADPEILAAIDYQASDAAVRLEAARNDSEKTHLTFKIPAPVVMMQGKIDQATIGNIKSHFLLNDDILTVMTTGLDKAEYPLAIDPTVSIDSASEFGFGTAEDNNQTIGGGDVTRGGLTGGAVGSWSTTTALPNGRTAHVSVAYNGYMYIMDGLGDGGANRYAQINSDGTLGSWQVLDMEDSPCFSGAAAYNGYVYILGGAGTCSTSWLSDVKYAKIGSDGNFTPTVFSWQPLNSLPTGIVNPTAAAYKGFLYVLGGYDTAARADVLMAPIKTDGTIGSWTSTTSFSTARYAHQSAVYNDYIYVYGGLNSSDSAIATVEYAPINGDGTVGTWATTTSFTVSARFSFRGFAYNGYLYLTGGSTNNNTGLTEIQYASINTNGTLGAWTTTTALSAGRFKHTAVAYNGHIYVAGGSQNNSNDTRTTVYYAALSPPGGLAGSSFSTTTGFTTARTEHRAVTYNGYMYIVGGQNTSGSYLNDVRYASISANGTVGSWSNTTAFSTGRADMEVVAYNGYMYVLGGATWGPGGSYYDDVQYAPINSNGTVGSWNTTTSLPDDITTRAAAYNGYMYIVGGGNDSGGDYTTTWYAPINSNGTLGSWTSSSSFSTNRWEYTIAVSNGYLYVLGGGTDGVTHLNDVQYAPINSNGSVGTWTATTSFSTARHNHATAVYNGVIYVIGGQAGADSSTHRIDVQYAAIKDDGTLDTWRTTTSITGVSTNGIVGMSAVAYNGFLYSTGGNSQHWNAGSGINTIQYLRINNGGPGTTGSWTSTSSFSGTRYGHGSVAYNGYMYILGGYNGSAYDDVQYAAINKTNGTLGSWSSAGPDFTTARYGLDVFVYNGYIYVLGGTTNGSVYLNDVQYAAINSDGTIGSWQTTTSFPTARYGHHVVAYDGYIYLTGGNSGSARNDVQYAPINSDGTLGSWSSGGTFTNARYGHDATINNGYIYIMAGNNSGTYYNDVQMAEIQGGGSLGSWTRLMPFHNPRYGIDSFAYNGYLYVVGGYNGSTYYADVQYAPFAPNGHIGPWQRTTDFTTARYVHTALAHNGYMYILGGNGGSYLNNVYYAPMNIMPRKATYSKILSFGSQSKITGISYTGNLIDGLRNIRYRFANSSGIFPTSAPRGADLPFTCDAGTHVQILATIDNTTSSVFPDSAGELGQINSITVTYDIPGVPTDKRLRHGAYFSSEELQPFDTRGCV